ncbi:hypothetical protein C9940_00605 [Pseudidiomarina aestuarii]|uniref:Uncharacterized protein n=1 Tax=Pseudidiomarina aestuarii TaxID=624146 RepID=A0A2T4CZ90_9GAMM|nr:hypothetical protein C9940_00605 [Pseudidiomarina aestuarii]
MNTITTLDEFLSRLAMLGINGELTDYEEILEQSDIKVLRAEGGTEFAEAHSCLIDFIQCLKERANGRKIWFLDNDFDPDEDTAWLELYGQSQTRLEA